MLAACEAALPADAAVFAAAVADWRVADLAKDKLKKADGPPALRLVANPDILALIAAPGPRRPRLVVGFAAETAELEAQCRRQAGAQERGLDRLPTMCGRRPALWVAPIISVTLFDANGQEAWPSMPKQDVAARLAARIAETINQDCA